MATREYYTVKDIAEILGYGEKTIRAWIKKRKLIGSSMPGGEFRIKITAFENWVQNRTREAKQTA